MPIASVTSTLTRLISDYGLYAIFALMLVDAVLPAASEVVMLYGGAIASGAIAGQTLTLLGQTLASGLAAYLAVALAGTLGYLVGAIGGWEIGRRGGKPFILKHGRWLRIDHATLERVDAWFNRWGDATVLVGRITPIVRSFISVPAGIFKAPFRRYVPLTAIGSAIWSFAFAAVGWATGTQWQSVHHGFRYAEWLVVLAGAAAVIFLAWRIAQRVRSFRTPPPT